MCILPGGLSNSYLQKHLFCTETCKRFYCPPLRKQSGGISQGWMCNPSPHPFVHLNNYWCTRYISLDVGRAGPGGPSLEKGPGAQILPGFQALVFWAECGKHLHFLAPHQCLPSHAKACLLHIFEDSAHIHTNNRLDTTLLVYINMLALVQKAT